MRNYNIDLIKIIAMAMVVYYRICYYKRDFDYDEGMEVYIPNATRVVMSLCSAGVLLSLVVMIISFMLGWTLRQIPGIRALVSI